MRILLGLLLLLMLLFGAFQYNDPDGIFWMGIYLVPAVWCGLGLFSPQAFKRKLVQVAFWASVAITVVGVIYFWPITPKFWTKDVWYNVETAREGMGLMIVLGVLLYVRLCVRKHGGVPEKVEYEACAPQS